MIIQIVTAEERVYNRLISLVRETAGQDVRAVCTRRKALHL